MKDIFIRGGPLMWPLLLCSILSLTISIERVIFWWKERRRRDRGNLERIFSHTEAGEFHIALSITDDRTVVPDIITRILVSGLASRHSGLREGMEVAAENEIERMKRGMDILDTIITIAPLLGILGTVLGIISSFDLLGKSGIDNPVAVSGGIAQALITTAAGLMVAIMTMLPFNYMVAKVKKTVREINNIMVRFEAVYRKGVEREKDGK